MSGYIESKFKTCLSSVRIPDSMKDGVPVLKVMQHGKTKAMYLTISPDQFIIYITPQKLKITNPTSNKHNNGATKGLLPIISSSITKPPLMKRVTSIGSNNTEEEYEYERAIEISTIDRIQIDQHTYRFENAR